MKVCVKRHHPSTQAHDLEIRATCMQWVSIPAVSNANTSNLIQIACLALPSPTLNRNSKRERFKLRTWFALWLKDGGSYSRGRHTVWFNAKSLRRRSTRIIPLSRWPNLARALTCKSHKPERVPNDWNRQNTNSFFISRVNHSCGATKWSKIKPVTANRRSTEVFLECLSLFLSQPKPTNRFNQNRNLNISRYQLIF